MMQQYEMGRTEIYDSDYPERLLSISKPPFELYYKGNNDIINQNRNIAVIGSRQVSGQGMEAAFRIGYELGRREINVVNGLALGCDTHALRGALAAGGTCVAVMPCGLGQIVPHSNTALADQLLSDGSCLLSEYPAHTPIRRYQYVERDRLQSGISDGVIVVEAECDSGTMHTVRYAIRQGRRLACIDSQLMQYSSGNRWIEKQKGVYVIRDVVDLNGFIADIQNDIVYRQATFDAIAVKG
ncbi:MAG: DNA-protecting protein DprA [Lachnospiraceae bacterium]|nr:DNA-protecting protein DprA [Lachnospiraceae bacterium]MDE7203813.1 DNA-protecting protein DprA [Lachnospiraceae bacterium]